jgi:hypothetical protein
MESSSDNRSLELAPPTGFSWNRIKEWLTGIERFRRDVE